MNTIRLTIPPGCVGPTVSWEVRYDLDTGKWVAVEAGGPSRFELRNVTIEASEPERKP